MKRMRSVLCAVVLLIMVACGKDGENTPNPPIPPSKKVLLTRLITESSGFKGYKQLVYDNAGKLAQIISDSFGKPGNLYIQFTYDANGRLIQSTDYGNAIGPMELVEIRKYYYDAAGNIIGDSAFKQNAEHTWYWDNRYSYDAQNRLLTVNTANGTQIRYDYGAGKNPLNKYVKYSTTQELPILKYDSFDNKKCIYFDNKTLLAYFRAFRWKYYEDFFPNNAVRYKEALGITSTAVLEYGDINEEFQYNASGYPIRRRITESTT